MNSLFKLPYPLSNGYYSESVDIYHILKKSAVEDL